MKINIDFKVNFTQEQPPAAEEAPEEPACDDPPAEDPPEEEPEEEETPEEETADPEPTDPDTGTEDVPETEGNEVGESVETETTMSTSEF